MEFHGVEIDNLSVAGCEFLLQQLESEQDLSEDTKADIEYLKKCIEEKKLS